MSEPFTVRVTARGYETDANGHVAAAVLLQYGQHARWECLRAAGLSQEELRARDVGPVSLEESIRFHREVQAGEALDISCRFVWGTGKSFRVEQELCRADGILAAEITNVGGVLDLQQRTLVQDPAAVWRSIAQAPRLLGL